MRMGRGILTVVLAFSATLLPMLLGAVQEPQPTAPPEPTASGEVADVPSPEEAEADYAYGTVIEVGPDRLVVNEYDELTGIAANVTYTVDSEVTFYEVQSLAEVAAGDDVDIDYVVKDGERHAVAIAVEKAAQEAGEAEEDSLR